jgi:hypothetical protein
MIKNEFVRRLFQWAVAVGGSRFGRKVFQKPKKSHKEARAEPMMNDE